MSPLVGGLIILAMIAWMCMLYRRNRALHSRRRTWMLLVPKVFLLTLVLAAIFDPSRAVWGRHDRKEKLLLLTDVSSSMDVRDEPGSSRLDRAAALRDRFVSELGDVFDLRFSAFDRDIREWDAAKPAAATVRGTDLGQCLMSLSQRGDLPEYLGIVMLTDGGDEPVHAQRLPATPLYIVGIGTDASTWNDLVLADVDAPAAAEDNTTFEVSADVLARRTGGEFASQSRALDVVLEDRKGAEWETLSTCKADLETERSRVTFKVPGGKDIGAREFRLRIPALAGELSLLNNERTFSVDIRKKTIYVLCFARKMDWDFALLRRELKDDPAVRVTSLYQAAQGSFQLEGDRQEGDDVLEKGFPADPRRLSPYKCIILGSFPADDLREEQQKALKKYVEEGGAVVFLGGPDSFGRGGYDATGLAPLFPWQINSTEPELTAGHYPVTVPPEAAAHGAIAATADALKGESGVEVYSVNHVGKLRTGAISLLDASADGRVLPVIALQPYGMGQTMGIATNTLWRWGRMSGGIRSAYGQFWRQAVRYLTGLQEGGRYLAVKWDKETYRPSEAAEASISIAGRYASGELHLSGTIAHDGQTLTVPIEPVLETDHAYRAKVVFPGRGLYVFRAEARVGSEKLDTSERTFRVGPTVNEGAALEVDHAFLDDLASRSGGKYARAAQVNRIIETLRAEAMARRVIRDVPLVQEKYGYLTLFMLILIAEWFCRRRMNLF
ncbi:MAG TPA: hypothetical protein PKG77_07995 [Phycisphaerae bacterium]|nr:hypothetical protein [Phycisphaerae bacterium]HQL73790.1 hypothetical protein [Phycisphaerae bacterium]